MLIATQIQRVILYGKTWVLYFAYPAAGLSHCLDQDKQLELAHAMIYCIKIQYIQRRRSVAHLLVLNLRDSAAEDHVRKRPFTIKPKPLYPFGLTELIAKIKSFFEKNKNNK